MNLSKFISLSHLDSNLIRAVVRQFGGFENFAESAEDVTRCGISGGFSGFIYYTDTVKFAAKHKPKILKTAEDLASDLGEDVFTMIGGFNCLKISASEAAEAIFNAKSEKRTLVFNALAWFAAEEVCRSYCDSLEN